MNHLFGNFSLRLFAEGESGEAAAPAADANAVSTVDFADDDGRLGRLRALGVPESKLTKRANTPRHNASGTLQNVQAASAAVQQVPNAASALPSEQNASAAMQGVQTRQQVAAAVTNAGEKTPGRMSWEDIMADPIYNKRMQQTLQSRLRSAKAAEQTLQRLAPAMELLAQKYGLKDNDAEALVNAIRAESRDNTVNSVNAVGSESNGNRANSDNTANNANAATHPAENANPATNPTANSAATQQGISEDTLQRQLQLSSSEETIQRHLQRLTEQGESLKRSFPAFDLRTELKNPAFVRMTSPAVGLPVEDAYFACHRRELQAAAMQAAAERTAQQLAASLRALQARPQENGGQAPSVTHFNYAGASREQREALKKSIRSASARGEKLYPGNE